MQARNDDRAVTVLDLEGIGRAVCELCYAENGPALLAFLRLEHDGPELVVDLLPAETVPLSEVLDKRADLNRVRKFEDEVLLLLGQ